MASGNSRSRSRTKVAAEADPKLLKRSERVGLVAEMLHALQKQAFEFDLMVGANGLGDDALAPAVAADQPPPGRTVAQQRKFYVEARRRVIEEHRDLIPEVEKLAEE